MMKNTNKESMIYIMNVDWNWIKQRPHFIAEQLNERYDIHAIYQYRYDRKGMQLRTTNVKLDSVYVIPRGDRYNISSGINKGIWKNAVRKAIRGTNAKFLYLTFPNQVDIIPDEYQGGVIYDCMDNHPEFISNHNKKNKLIDQERRLVKKADYIFSSSCYLTEQLKLRYGTEIGAKIYLVRNGYNGDIVEIEKTKAEKKCELYTFSYFGTISTWFNFDYILKSLDEFPDIQYELFGPVVGVQIPEHERIHYHGTVEHDCLLNNIKNADCLIMPFVVNEIIKAVDPVKLYEYINFNKNILVPNYDEIKRFEKFVYFYNDYADFKQQILTLKEVEYIKYSNADRSSFLMDNSWKQRVKYIIGVLDSKGER